MINISKVIGPQIMVKWDAFNTKQLDIPHLVHVLQALQWSCMTLNYISALEKTYILQE